MINIYAFDLVVIDKLYILCSCNNNFVTVALEPLFGLSGVFIASSLPKNVFWTIEWPSGYSGWCDDSGSYDDLRSMFSLETPAKTLEFLIREVTFNPSIYLFKFLVYCFSLLPHLSLLHYCISFSFFFLCFCVIFLLTLVFVENQNPSLAGILLRDLVVVSWCFSSDFENFFKIC